MALIAFYRLAISPYLLPSCRFQPTCSKYALDAYKNFNFFIASFFVVKRICKCHPLGGQGYDPLPLKETAS
ncbi:MAG: membrane protein insertion efficiency factor YidD [Bdellovibrionales bacterium]|nr:membrane protein insertion efficiency factor YidD [Bdellovibrionales bacterium]